MVGSSLRCDSARAEQKPPTPSGVTVDSHPPATITSASPRSIARAASPSECAPVEHADTIDRLGPRASKRIDTCPGARLMITAGTKYGLIPSRGPFSIHLPWVLSRIGMPPIPAPMYTPNRSGSGLSSSSPASLIAMSADAIAYWMKMSICRSSRLAIHCSGSKSRTSPAMVVVKSEASNFVMGPMPDSPARTAAQVRSVSRPSGVMSPMPVIAILRRATCCPALRAASWCAS